MSIYIKLAQARVRLQNEPLKQSGCNSFSKYTYFQLTDFLPKVNEIFNDLKMVGVISFDENLATLTIHDGESAEKIVFTSPMKSANLKGCHEIQNLGAVETYQRRYLYMVALEIVENDILEENTGNTKLADTPKQKSQTYSSNSTAQNANPKSVNHTIIDTFKERFAGCKDKESMSKMYDKLLDWTKKNQPVLVNELGIIYDEEISNLM